MSLSDTARQHIQTTLANVCHGERTDTARKLAKLYGISLATIYRFSKRQGTRKRRALTKPEYRTWVQRAAIIACQSPKPIPLDLAIQAGIATGVLPPAADKMPLGTAYRIRRELGLVKSTARTQRLCADYPMQAVQIDGSSSELLTVVTALADDDWLLKLYRRPYSATGYKNKPLGPDRERLLVYGMWDMCTGFKLARYTVAKGEASLDAVEFLLWALAQKTDLRIPFHGIPDDLWSDQGPLFKSAAAVNLLDRLNINLVTGAPYNKTRMGGVERAWRTLWSRFERTFFLRGLDEIKLSELNNRLLEFSIEENDRPARVQVRGHTVSRTKAWSLLTNQRPEDNRLRQLPAEALATLAKETRRHLNQNGHLRLDGALYEVPHLFDCWVIARKSLEDSNKVIVECEQSGRRETAKLFTPRPYGQIRSAEAPPIKRLLNAEAKPPPADLYAPDIQSSNILPMPGRSAKAATLDNPLDAGTYKNLSEALKAFIAIYPHPLTAQNRALVEKKLLAERLNKEAVRELALELLNYTQKEKRA